jgi:hypothetical protein
MMTKLRRLLGNVPVPRFAVPRFGAASTLAVLIAMSALLATSALLVAPALFGPPALAAETLGPDPSINLPAGLPGAPAEDASIRIAFSYQLGTGR